MQRVVLDPSVLVSPVISRSGAPAATPVTWDTADDYVVALGVEASAEAIVSGDADLLELENPPIPILTPRQFLEQLDESA